MTLKKWIVGAVVALGLVSLTACSSSSNTKKDNWDTYQSKKTITIGFDNTFVPMGYEIEKGKNVGFDIDLANAVFKQYGITVKWQPINWDLKETELTNGKIDMI